MKKNVLKNVLKNLALILGLIGLQGCSTLEIAHVPLACLDKPAIRFIDRIDLDDLNSMTDAAFDAVEAHIIAYHERLKSECLLIKAHNELHSS